MATPHVAGLAALVKAAAPPSTASQITQAIMNRVDLKFCRSGKCVTGGRIDVYKVIQGYSVSVPTVPSLILVCTKNGLRLLGTNLSGI